MLDIFIVSDFIAMNFTLAVVFFLQSIMGLMVPQGYRRISTDAFGNHIRGIKLKADKTVYLYNGKKKFNQDAQVAVLDIPIGQQDLLQCADAAMCIRADYLFDAARYTDIGFLAVSGGVMKMSAPYTRERLQKYLLGVYNRCNSFSLEKQLKLKPIKGVQIGDVLIKGGFPGHVTIVVDVAMNASGEKIFMLAQGYMPAQDIHVLKGPIDGKWYPAKEGVIETPEWTFRSDQLKGW